MKEEKHQFIPQEHYIYIYIHYEQLHAKKLDNLEKNGHTPRNIQLTKTESRQKR